MTLPTHSFPLFVLPFLAGLAFLLGWLAVQFINWIRQIDRNELMIIGKNVFSTKTIKASIEVFAESLLHRKLFRKNFMLGYMHMCFALGWFLLILVGKFEVISYSGKITARPYVAIFFKYFVSPLDKFPYSAVYSFLMDLFLLFVLSGLVLALIKRFRSKALGMTHTTQHKPIDKWALAFLWMIFPARYLAESLASGSNGYSFLTGQTGQLLASFLPVEQLQMPVWWLYSLALGGFFVLLPYSRYMHIPTEAVYIFLKHWGASKREVNQGLTNFEIYSCSRCGVCIDVCQMKTQANVSTVQGVNFTRDIRNNTLTEENLNNCLLCGRCTQACPVGIDLTLQKRMYREQFARFNQNDFSFFEKEKERRVSKTIYFPGCMSSLTPGIEKSMVKIMQQAGEDFWVMNEDSGSVCCGRPMFLSGNTEAAKRMAEINLEIIRKSGASQLVTSCPICYKMFRENYELPIPVVHHSEYLQQLSEAGKISIKNEKLQMVYHDPCELGRGSGTYEAPRRLLQQSGVLLTTGFERENGLCCGGSLANTEADQSLKDTIAGHVVQSLCVPGTQVLATACPVCKRSLAKQSPVQVMDIAEITASQLIEAKSEKKIQKKEVELI